MQRVQRRPNLSATAKVAIGAGIIFIGLPLVAVAAVAVIGARAVSNAANRPFPTFPIDPGYPTYPSFPPPVPMRRGRGPL